MNSSLALGEKAKSAAQAALQNYLLSLVSTEATTTGQLDYYINTCLQNGSRVIIEKKWLQVNCVLITWVAESHPQLQP